MTNYDVGLQVVVDEGREIRVEPVAIEETEVISITANHVPFPDHLLFSLEKEDHPAYRAERGETTTPSEGMPDHWCDTEVHTAYHGTNVTLVWQRVIGLICKAWHDRYPEDPQREARLQYARDLLSGAVIPARVETEEILPMVEDGEMAPNGRRVGIGPLAITDWSQVERLAGCLYHRDQGR